jgi:hypothetical protein
LRDLKRLQKRDHKTNRRLARSRRGWMSSDALAAPNVGLK